MRVPKFTVFFAVSIPLFGIVLILSILVCDDSYWIDSNGIPTLARYSEGAGHDAVGAVNDLLPLPDEHIRSSLALADNQTLTSVTVYDVSQKIIQEKDPYLPEALQPITYKKCCKMALATTRKRSKADKRNDRCKHICFSKNACTNKLYPFSSEKEKAFFSQEKKKWKNKKYRHPAIKKCAGIMSKNPPQPTRWCQNQRLEKQPIHDTNLTLLDINLTNIPMGCSMVMGMGGMSGPWDRTMLFPKGKLAFCGIPKVGISSWLQFLRFTLGAKDYQSAPHLKTDINFLRFDRLRPRKRKTLLMTEAWTKAIILRNPAERFLSAYLDKVDGSSLSWLRDMTFAEFVDFVDDKNTTCQAIRGPLTQSGITWCMDPHWRPQVWSCGLWELLPYFDIVGSMDSADLVTRVILEKANLWDSYGKHYITSKGQNAGDKICKMPPPPLNEVKEEHKGFQQYHHPVTNTTARLYGNKHKKDSSSKMEKYYTKELLDKVKKLYADDYTIWNALSKSKVGWLSGRQLAAMLNPTCVVD